MIWKGPRMACRQSLQFTDEQRRQLNHQRFHHPHERVRQRMELLWLISQGESPQRAAQLAGVSRTTGWRYQTIYHQGGVAALQQINWSGSSSELEPYRAMLETSFNQQPPHTVDEAAQRIEQITGLHRQPSTVRELLHSMGLNWRRMAAIPVPPKKTSPSTSASKHGLSRMNWSLA